jgi:lactaldehyde dehydrogenase / glycolaldehyde dehydrogenase
MNVQAPSKTLLIDGSWIIPSDNPHEVVNPTTGEPIAAIGSATKDEVHAGLEAARRAQTAWAKMPAIHRSSYLRAIADVLVKHRDELAMHLVEEVGKPIAQAQGEVDWAVAYIKYTAEWDRRIEGEIVPSDSEAESIHLVRVPLGVVAALCAWNFPLALYFRKVAPALLTGNTVVVKPSETTPLTSLRATQLIADEVDLPPGVLNMVTGGRETGRALVTNPLTNLVTMTGHRESGKQVMADAASNLTRISLELGGKAPVIIWKDADLDATIEAVVMARHANTGQVCTCAERVFVHHDIREEVVRRYTHAVSQLRLGNPYDEVDMGPLVSARHLEKVETAVAQASDDGARIEVGGSRPSGGGFDRGFWFEPTVLTDVDPSMAIMRDEVFGPVTPIMGVRTLEEAFDLANDSPYGLSAYVFTNDYRTAMRAAHDVDFGEIYINRTLGEAMQGHHSGHRQSGLGGEDGKHGVLKYTQLKTVYHRYG